MGRNCSLRGSTSFCVVNGLTTLVPRGFELGNSINNFTEDFPSYDLTSQGNGVYSFSTKLTNLKPDTYYYRAYTYDGMNYNYGEPCSFTIDEQAPENKVVMLTETVGGTTYEIYKVNTDTDDYHINPDGWKCYKSSLMLSFIKDGNTSTYTLDDNIYLDSSDNDHGGQKPCLYLNSVSDELFIFINSKDSGSRYTMDGYAYRSSLNNISFTKETVYTARNWGWYPYFTYSGGVLSVQHFSFAGYYAMTSVRNSDGTWTTIQGNSIKPDAFREQSEQVGNVLVIQEEDNPGGDMPTGYTSCPDGNHPHMIDLGLPSGTKWACCHVGATEPADYGGYYAWGETMEKETYSSSTYTVDAEVVDIGGTAMDVAHVLWGSNWQMPSNEQINELLENCTMSDLIVKDNGVEGFEILGKNGGKIFIPFSGYIDGQNCRGLNQHACLMSSKRDVSKNAAFFSGVAFGSYARWRYFRYHGNSVRAVWQ